MMKAAWKMCKDSDSLGIQVVKSKYKCGGGIYHLASLRSLGALVSGVVCAVGGLCWNLTCVGGWGMEG